MMFHPDSELLIKYASGQLETSLSLAIALHQQNCPQCQQKIAELESIGGEALDYVCVESLNTDETIDLNFKQLIQSINSLSEKNIESSYNIAIAETDLELFKKLNQNNFHDITWQKITSKIYKAPIAVNDSEYKIELLKLSPNTKVPKHTHKGNEFTLVLEGNFSDKNGQYEQGAFVTKNENHEHQPIAGKTGCICLTITNAPLKYTGTFGQVLNWFG